MCCKILIGGVAFIVGVEVGKRLPKRETVETFKTNVVRRVTRVIAEEALDAALPKDDQGVKPRE